MPFGLKRYQQTGKTHFVTFSCYHRRAFFARWIHVGHNVGAPHLSAVGRCGCSSCRCSNLFLESLEHTRRRYGFRVFGYVVMPEHIHLLVSEPDIELLATAIQALKISVARLAPSAGWHCDWPFWQKRYYDHNVRSERSFVNKLRYIHRNPVKRGLVASPEQWPWSSFLHYLTAEPAVVEIESYWTAIRREGRLPHLPKPGRCGAPTWEGWSE